MSEQREKYGLKFPKRYDDAQIERELLRQGGYFIFGDKKLGLGLFQHFNNYWALLWPDDAQTRWTDLILSEILGNRFVGIIGPSNSWKTSTCARIALMDWSLFPECTMVLVSSTTMDDLKNRIYGEITKFWQRAREQYAWFPGFPIDYKCVIAAEDIEEELIRDLRNGIQGVPNKTPDGKVQGLSKFVGRKNTRVWTLCDEVQFCILGHLIIDTMTGLRRMDSIQAGDMIANANGWGRVTKVHRRISSELGCLKLKDGRVIYCTPDHNIFTQFGWIKACHANESHYIVSHYEAVHLLRFGVHPLRKPTGVRPVPAGESAMPSVREDESEEANREHQAAVLQSILRVEVSHVRPDHSEKDFYPGAPFEKWRGDEACPPRAPGVWRTLPQDGDGGQLHEVSRESSQAQFDAESYGSQTSDSGRQWHGADQGGVGPSRVVSRFKDKLRLAHENAQGVWNSNALQDRRGAPALETRHRSGRTLSQSLEAERSGREEDAISRGAWVDSFTLLESPDFGGYGNGSSGVEVYNLTVEGHPSYSVNGLLVHNCERSFLQAQDNLSSNGPNLLPGYQRDEYGVIKLNSKGEKKVLAGYRGVFLGNPNPTRPENCLHMVCEPEDGWASIADDGTTKTWLAKRIPNSVVQCKVINLDGRDSPNNDYPNDKPRWPNLISRKRLAEFQLDTESYWTQGVGFVKLGLAGSKVITRELCDQFHAFDALTWEGSEPTTKIGHADAAYGVVGGDRCVVGWSEFSKCLDGVTRILFHPPVIMPVTIRQDMIVEDQIAMFFKNQMETAGVPPENFFFDGRGSLATSIAKIWSPRINAVEFGGNVTKRPVGPDIFTDDPITRIRRLKLADEHYSKFVSELWWSWRYTIQGDQVRGLTLETVLDAMPREWYKVRGDKIEIETKEKMKKRTGCSPDLGDWACIGIEGARRRGFNVARLAVVPPKKTARESWLDKHLSKLEAVNQEQELLAI